MGDEAQGKLEQLVAAESRIAALTQQAAAEARQVVDSARARAQESERRAGEELLQTLSRLERETEQDRLRQLGSVAADLDRQLAFIETVADGRITELALFALNRLLQPTKAVPRP